MTFFKIVSYLFILAVLSSFLGFIHPIFDSISVFRQYLAIPICLSFIISCYSKKHRLAFVSFFIIIIIFFSTFSLFKSNHLPKNTEHAHHALYQKNLSFRLKSYNALITDIQKTNPDFITLQEVTKRHKRILNRLKTSYPYQHHCDFGTVGGIAILSKVPLEKDSYACLNGSVRAKLQDKNIWLTSLHLHWPWPFQQEQQLQDIVNGLSKLNGQHIIAGDFNTVKWSTNIHEIHKRLHTQSVNETNYSFFLENFLPIAIDQVLLPKSTQSISSTRPLLGSDHKGIYAEFLIENPL